MANVGTTRYYFIFLPILIIGGFFFVLYNGLTINPYGTTVKTINKPVPSIKQTDLFQWNNLINTASFKNENRGHWYLINLWASWCDTCLNEHPFLMDLARQGITIYGVDNNDSALSAKKWLASYGNPYADVLWDARSVVAVNLGMTSVPTTFLVDPNGIMRLQVTGALTAKIWQEDMLPLIENHGKKPEKE